MPKTIMAAIDLASSTDQVLAAAKEYSKAFSAKLYLVHVAIPPEMMLISPLEEDVGLEGVPIPIDREVEADRLRRDHKAMQDLGRELSDAGVDVTSIAIEGSAVEGLLEEIERLGIDLVIMGSHAPSLLEFLVGSTTKGVMHGAHCPVLVLPPT